MPPRVIPQLTPPFRLAPRIAAPGTSGTEAAVDLQLIADCAFAPPAVVGGWLEHPDERVPVAAMEKYQGLMTTSSVGLHHIAIRLAAMDAAEPDQWTAVRDVFFRFAPTHVQTRSCRRALRQWVRAQDDPTAFNDLLQFPSGFPQRELARQARVWAPDQVARLCRARAPEMPTLIAQNPALPGHAIESLLDEIFVVLGDARASVAAVKGYRLAFDALLARGVPAPADLYDRVARVIRQTQGPGLRHVSPQARAALSLLRCARAITTAGFLDLYDSVAALPMLVAEVLTHPACPLSVAREAAETGSSLAVRRAIARREDWRHDPVIRAALSTRGHDAHVIGVLLAEATPSEIDPLFSRMAKGNADAAVRLLEDGVVAAERVAPASTAPLFLAKRDTVRVRALSLMHRIGTARDAEAEAPAVRDAEPRGPGRRP